MKLFAGLVAVCLWTSANALQQDQSILRDEEPKPLNVAIIGTFCIESRSCEDHH